MNFCHLKRMIREVLAKDYALRNPKVLSAQPDMFELKDLSFTKDYDYSMPTIYSDQAVNLKNQMIHDLETFKVAFNKKYSSYLSQLQMDHVVIAGGSVCGILLKQDLDVDVDLFVYGLSYEEADAKVEDMLKQLYKSYELSVIKKKEEKDKVELNQEQSDQLIFEKATFKNIRNKNSITVIFEDGMKVQIILRLYSTISEILHGFDLGSSAVGFDNGKVYFTTLSKHSYEYLVNIVDPSRRSTTYELRLIKYYQRGFSIVMPDLDIKRLRTNYFKYGMVEVAELPYLTFTYRDVKGNKIFLATVIKYGTRTTRCEVDSDYAPDDFNEYKLFYLNLKNLVRQEDNYYYYSEKTNLDILTNPPYITRSRIIDFYDSLHKKIYDRCNFDLQAFTSYFDLSTVTEAVNEIVVKKNLSYLDGLIEDQKVLVLSRLDEVRKKKHYELPWIITDPGSQLTGSFNPLLSDPKDWYGKYYINSPWKDC